MKSTTSIRIHLNLPEQQQSRRPSLSKLSLTKTISNGSPISLDRQRMPRLSTVSSSYTQFLKQRDMEKNKKIVIKKMLYMFFLSFKFYFSYHKKIIVYYYHQVNGLK